MENREPCRLAASGHRPKVGPEARAPVVVYKVGGSLLDLPDLPQRLQCVAPSDGSILPLFIVGGGPTADIVRNWDRLHQLGQERAHWLAMKSLRLNEALLAELIPAARVISTRDGAQACWMDSDWPILCTHDFVQAEERTADVRLPHTWEVTSDSIAAWVALCWPADRLVLLKSTALPVDRQTTNLMSSGTVDAHFAELSPRLPKVEWVNLRSDDPAAEEWRPASVPVPSSPT